MHAEHVPLSATGKRLRLRRLRLGVTRGAGAAMASCTWSDEETFVLIEIWGEDSIQAMLEGTRRNKDVFVKIAKAIEERGFSKSAVQCSAKIKRLRLEYKQIRDANSRSGRGRTDWKFYNAMDGVLGTKPATEPPVVVESLRSTGESDGTELEATCDLDGQELEEVHTQCSSSSSQQTTTCETPDNSTHTVPKPSKKGKKRARSEDTLDRMEHIVEKMIKCQEDSEKNYLKFEEKILEMEEKRRKESQEMFMRLMAMTLPPQSGVGLTHSYSMPGFTPVSSPHSNILHPMYSSFMSPEHDN